MNTEVRLLKLTNGEDIIASVDQTNPELYNLDNPLLMRVRSKLTPNGVQEGLHLSRWIQPFSEETKFSIEKQHVVLSTEVSIGLTRYYEYSIKTFERDDSDINLPDSIEPTEKELMELALEEAVAEDEEEFMSLEPISKAIH
tara:strand:- start:71 stop:496 length:426 start_codon:yes stop_codon:yes gene_type:complete